VMGVAFSRNGTRLVTGGNDNCAIVWEPTTGRQVRKLPHASLVALAKFSPDGQRLSTCSDDGTIKVWEVETGLETLSLRGHTSVVRGLSLSPDGTHLASSSDDGTIRTWDARTWTAEAAAEASSEREALGSLDFLFAMPLRKD